MSLPIGRRCPACGDAAYVGSRWSLMDARTCGACGVRYAPSMPIGGYVLLLFVAVLTAALALVVTILMFASVIRSSTGGLVALALLPFAVVLGASSWSMLRAAADGIKGSTGEERRGFEVRPRDAK